MNPESTLPDGTVEILVVEDSRTQAERVKHLLEEQGYTVRLAVDGNEALRAVRKRKPTIVLSDILMPGMDGFALCKEIKSQEDLKDVPVILLTSLTSPQDIMQGLECGADNFIRKPCDDKYLLSRIEFILVNRKLRRSERTQFGVEIYFIGKKYFITSERQQILDLLISTYEDAVRLNEELQARQGELRQLTRDLEKTVEERTAALRAEVEERTRAEAALRESSERLRQMAENIKEVFFLADATGRTIYINEAYEEFYGRTRESLYKDPMSWLEAVHHDDRDRVTATVEKAVREGTEIAQDFRIVRPDGSTRWILNRVSPVRDEQGRVIRFVGTAQDITESKKLEEQLRQAAKMEAIGQLAGGVAHDFNNLLTIITGYSELLFERLGPDDPVRGYVKEIKDAADRASSLTRQLLAFGRRQVLQSQLLDLNLVVAGMDKMLRRLIGEDIDLVTVPGPALGRVKADPGQVEQIIMNLAVNARDAMPHGGKLTIETANVDLDEAYARDHVAVTPGRHVMLAVSDTGHGMDEETRSHIFEPFFTTKEQGKGTGLGLATVYGIVKQSGGNIWVYSEPGRGATFKIYLPWVGEEEESVVPAEAHAALLTGSETVLLVEDEAALRALARDVLRSNGYTVLEARSAPDALLICERYKKPIQLLLTDVVMPQLGGREVAERLKSSHPEAKVLYMSGYTDNAIVHHGVLEAGTAFLQKPFTPTALLGKVREVLGAQFPV